MSHHQLINKPIRKYLPKDFKITTWDELKVYFDLLVERDITSALELRKWFQDRSELESVISEDFAWRYIKMTCYTEDQAYRDSYQYFVENIQPKIAPYADELNKKGVSSEFIKQLSSEEGYDLLVRNIKNEIEIFRENNIPLFTEVSTESQKYGQELKYDRAYYIGEQDFYIPKDENGNYKKYNSPAESMADDLKVMEGLIPTHIVFNGRAGSLSGANAMPAKVGETVLIIHSQANYDTRPHLIGGHGDYVWETGSLMDPPQTDLETWFIRGGSAGAAIYTFKQPGIYAYLNHNLIEAVLKGAYAHFKVEGEWDDNLMKQVKKPTPIME
jgi:hypothetical protein